ncbi:MAG: hypothetical protein M2R45_00873 [Verrucomicrobia subdivision 3 bacterium]|nr:hypothetical protein [Limisphaerales bacterium]MCS1414541.1 hypothetical protein [Limisphaerales bacterium]
MTERQKKLLFVGVVSVLAIVFTTITKFSATWRKQQAIAREEAREDSWKSASFINLTDFQKVAGGVDEMMSKGTNVHLLSEQQMVALKSRIRSCLDAYSQGDFGKYLDFRMPCGRGIVTFDEAEIKKYKYNLPSRGKLQEVIEKIQANRDIPKTSLKELQRYSLSNSLDVWKYQWILGGLIRYTASGGRVWCTDCWTGFSPDESWVHINELPQSAAQLARQNGDSGIFTSPPDLKLSPPSGKTDSTPKMYAAVRLHMNTKLKVSAHPVFVVFVLTTKPECWQPMSFASCYYMGTKYMF